MQKNIITVWIVLIATFIICCPVQNASANSAPIVFTSNVQNIITDNTTTVYLTAASDDAVSWEIKDASVARIQSSNTRTAVVEGLKQGETLLTATDAEGNNVTCKVVVKNPALSIKSTLRMQIESTEQLYLSEGSASNWVSSNSDIVLVEDSNEYYASIRAVGLGQATVSAIDKYGTEAKCVVTVKEGPEFYVYISPDYLLYSNDNSGGYYESATFNYYRDWYSQESDGWWDDNWNWHDTITTYNTLDSFIVSANNEIKKAYSQNTNIVTVIPITVSPDGNEYSIKPVKIGQTNVIIEDKYGETATIPCAVTLRYMLERYEYVYSYDENYREDQFNPKSYHYYNIKYASGFAEGITYKKAAVSINIKGKKYAGKANGSGYYKIKIPKYLKLGTKASITTSQYGYTYKCSRKVITNNPGLSVGTIKKNSTKVKVTANNLHVGDSIRVKVGKKVYKKKIKKNTKKLAYTVKIKKPKKIKKVNVSIYNKFNQVLKTKNVIVKKK